MPGLENDFDVPRTREGFLPTAQDLNIKLGTRKHAKGTDIEPRQLGNDGAKGAVGLPIPANFRIEAATTKGSVAQGVTWSCGCFPRTPGKR
jgi:hypothetical protein